MNTINTVILFILKKGFQMKIDTIIMKTKKEDTLSHYNARFTCPIPGVM